MRRGSADAARATARDGPREVHATIGLAEQLGSLGADARALVERAGERLGLSMRGLGKALSVARTIAHLDVDRAEINKVKNTRWSHVGLLPDALRALAGPVPQTPLDALTGGALAILSIGAVMVVYSRRSRGVVLAQLSTCGLMVALLFTLGLATVV